MVRLSPACPNAAAGPGKSADMPSMFLTFFFRFSHGDSNAAEIGLFDQRKRILVESCKILGKKFPKLQTFTIGERSQASSFCRDARDSVQVADPALIQ